jgi:hypothetical protein
MFMNDLSTISWVEIHGYERFRGLKPTATREPSLWLLKMPIEIPWVETHGYKRIKPMVFLFAFTRAIGLILL